MSISQNFPSTRPSLNLNFARSQKLDPRITFTRTTTGTRVGPDGYIEVVPADQPRFDFDPISGECLGLLIEESRVNLFTWSENLNNVGWSTFLSSVTPNTNISPSGDISADTITFTANQFADINFPVGIQTGVTYTASIWARSVSGISTFRIKYWNGSVGTYSSNITVTETWERYNYTFVGTASAGFPNIGFSNSSDGSSKSVVLWGAQLEQGSFPTSYIPTEGSTASRNPDNVSITGQAFQDFYNQSEGTVYTRYSPYTQIPSLNNTIFCFELSSNNAIRLLHQASTGRALYQVQTPGGLSVNLSRGVFTFTAKEFTDLSISYAQDDFVISGFGGISEDDSGDVPIGITNLKIGNTALFPTTYSNGHISQLIYYPVRLSNDQLITLTK